MSATQLGGGDEVRSAVVTNEEGPRGVSEGNGTAVVNLARGNVTKLECNCGQPATTVIPPEEAEIAILCGDGQVMPEKNPAALYEKYLMMAQNFSSFADIWIYKSARCS